MAVLLAVGINKPPLRLKMELPRSRDRLGVRSVPPSSFISSRRAGDRGNVHIAIGDDEAAALIEVARARRIAPPEAARRAQCSAAQVVNSDSAHRRFVGPPAQ